MKFFYPSLSLLALSFFLSSCALSPGQHLDANQRGFLEDEQRVLVVSLNTGNLSMLASDTETATSEEISALVNDKPEMYRLGVGDRLLINVLESPAFIADTNIIQNIESNVRVIQPDGSLFYPYVGTIKVAGLTISELRQIITAGLSKILIEPQVDIRITDFVSQQVLISGAFTNTKPQFITDQHLTLLEAINVAQINESVADRSQLLLTRGDKTYRFNLEAIERSDGALLGKIFLKADDVIYLSNGIEKTFFVLGEVPRSGEFRYRKAALTLTEAIGMAGGLRPETSNGKAVYLIRNIDNFTRSRDPVIVYQLDLRSPAAFTVASQVRINPQDVVFVGAQGITRWNRFVSQLFPSLNFFSTLPRNLNVE